MKVCVAQTKPVKANIARNIDNHIKLIDLAVLNNADVIVFPELSLTGYEPELAATLAIDLEDSRLDCFQQISNQHHIMIGVGIPTKNTTGTSISMAVFQANKSRQLYSKYFLHGDEEAYFVSGPNLTGITVKDTNVALAICYELSVPEHAVTAANSGAHIYLTSVAKSASGVATAAETLSGIARNYSMTVLMSNCVGYCDNFESAGQTSIWNSKGQLEAQLDDSSEGLLMIDTSTGKTTMLHFEQTPSSSHN